MDRCRCGKEPVYYLRYTGKHLCEAHFLQMFDKRMKQAVRKHAMIKKGDLVAVGLSGGKDSCSLLDSLCRLRKALPFRLVAITIDEGIEGYRRKTLEIAKRECGRLGVEHRIVRFKDISGRTLDEMIQEGKEMPCSLCGVMRRYLLNKAAREEGASKLALGHNLDDLAQTVIMNIMRNEPSRLARLNEPAVQDGRMVRRIRPLMMIPEKEIALYCMLKGIDIGGTECPYAHTALRQDVRAMLNKMEEKHPGTKFKIAGSFFAMEASLREGFKPDGKIPTCPKCGEISSEGECMFCRMIGSRHKAQ